MAGGIESSSIIQKAIKATKAKEQASSKQ